MDRPSARPPLRGVFAAVPPARTGSAPVKGLCPIAEAPGVARNRFIAIQLKTVRSCVVLGLYTPTYALDIVSALLNRDDIDDSQRTQLITFRDELMNMVTILSA